MVTASAQPPTPLPILIVDDEEGVRNMLARSLSKHGFAVSVAADGHEALESVRTGSYPLMLIDVRMPGMDGIALLRQIQRKKLPTIPIMMSAFVDLEVAIEAMESGAADYIAKPFRFEEVLLKLRLAQERRRLQEDHARLAAQVSEVAVSGEVAKTTQGIVGESAAMQKIAGLIQKVADHKSTVLLLGESGTGKELVARALHDQSSRADAPFVPINCGAIPESLIESELFGHVKGAFTDASRTKRGLVQEADGGTLFLDEIGELPLAVQAKLLRFLQEGEVRAVGENRGAKVSARVVAATARDLSGMVASGQFREDLYYRLNVLQISIPPLRERRDDIPLLVEFFLGRFTTQMKRSKMRFSDEAMQHLMTYGWPGNVRELENTIERSVVLEETSTIGIDNLSEKIFQTNNHASDLPLFGDDLSIKRAVRTVERELIRRSLEKTGGNRTRAAELLEISHRALLYKIKEYGLH